MKYAVTYLSQTGSTKKVADAIAEALPGDVKLGTFPELPDPTGYDLVFVGFPIHGYGPAKEAEAYLKEACAGKQVALFVTHAAPEGPGLLEEWLDKCKAAACDCQLAGLFDCQGELAPVVKQHMLHSDSPELKRWAENDNSEGQPDAVRLEKAREFATKLAAAVSAG